MGQRGQNQNGTKGAESEQNKGGRIRTEQRGQNQNRTKGAESEQNRRAESEPMLGYNCQSSFCLSLSILNFYLLVLHPVTIFVFF